MVLTVYLLVAGAALASARHPRDVNRYLVLTQADPDHSHRGHYSGQDVERRNKDYRRSVNSNRQLPYSLAPVIQVQPVYSDGNVGYSYVTESDHVALISEKVDSFNNIQNEFKLRTNAYPTNTNEITEILVTTEPIHENRGRDHGNVEGRNIASNHYGESEIGRKESLANRGSHNIDSQTRYVPHEAQPNVNNGDSAKTYFMVVKTNRGHASKAALDDKNRATERARDRYPDSSNISTSYRNLEEEQRDTVPKGEDEQEVPWVWGSEPGPTARSSEPDDLDDRAAFDGSACATGYVKVQGVCVERH